MHERSEHVTRILFFVAGGLAGAGAALFLAPQSGRDTRGRVGRRLRRAARKARALRDTPAGRDGRAGVIPQDDGQRPAAAGGTAVPI